MLNSWIFMNNPPPHENMLTSIWADNGWKQIFEKYVNSWIAVAAPFQGDHWDFVTFVFFSWWHCGSRLEVKR
jgi:hypothetical protein